LIAIRIIVSPDPLCTGFWTLAGNLLLHHFVYAFVAPEVEHRLQARFFYCARSYPTVKIDFLSHLCYSPDPECGFFRNYQRLFVSRSILVKLRQLLSLRRRGKQLNTVSEIFLPQLFRAATFGERPRQAADAHLAGSQHRCSFDRAGALKVCLRCVGIFDWKDWQNKKSAARGTDTTMWLGIFLEMNAIDSDVLSWIGVK